VRAAGVFWQGWVIKSAACQTADSEQGNNPDLYFIPQHCLIPFCNKDEINKAVLNAYRYLSLLKKARTDCPG
jgi:hypothetical protein